MTAPCQPTCDSPPHWPTCGPSAGHRGGDRGTTVGRDLPASSTRSSPTPDAVLASNTSSIPDHEDRGGHQNPGPGPGAALFNLVSGAPGSNWSPPWRPAREPRHVPSTSPARCWANQVVRCSDRSGFVVNFYWCPIYCRRSGWWRRGGHRRGRRDKAVVAGLSHPMGPLRLSDLIGLDTLKLIADDRSTDWRRTTRRLRCCCGWWRQDGWKPVRPGLLQLPIGAVSAAWEVHLTRPLG